MRKLVVLSFDACFDQDLSAWPEGTGLGNWLRSAAGSAGVKCIFPSITYPSHTTLITGCLPAQHGIGQNQPYQPDTDAEHRKWYWKRRDVKVLSLIDAVHQAGGKAASILWPVTGKHSHIRWNFPEVLALPGENQVLKMLSYGSPLYVLSTELRLGRQRKGTREPHLSAYAALLAEDVIRRHAPDLTLVHLVDVDAMRHHYGTNSPEAKAGLQRLQDHFLRVLNAIRETAAMGKDAILAVISDHGQADITRIIHLRDTLAEAGIKSVGTQSNGSSLYFYPGMGGQDALNAAKAYIRQHQAELGIKALFDRDTLDQLGCIPQVAFAVDGEPGVAFEDDLPETKLEKATHGYGPGHPAENCLFFMGGEGIHPGMRIPQMAMQDVAPTLAAWMGIPLPHAIGRSWKQEMEI